MVKRRGFPLDKCTGCSVVIEGFIAEFPDAGELLCRDCFEKRPPPAVEAE